MSGLIPVSPANGEFKRPESQFRNFIPPEAASPGRYHLYVSFACPWAHRTLIVRNLKKLQEVIPYSVTNPYMGEKGWSFGSGHEVEYLSSVYHAAVQNYTGKITVPVLWDNLKDTIVNNESADIIRMLNSAFNGCTDSTIDLYPVRLRAKIDEMNDVIYENVNNGVYKAGFAQKQTAYDEAFKGLFRTLDHLDNILGEQRFLIGDKITETDIRLFTTLVRFDVVYYLHFKCNLKLIREYKNLSNYLRCLYQIPEFKKTCHFDHIKDHYYMSHKMINPFRIVPLGPEFDLDRSHDRGPVEYFETEAKNH